MTPRSLGPLSLGPLSLGPLSLGPLLGLLLACAEKPEADGQLIRLALNWFPEPEFGGFYEGVLGGHYERAGFAVQIIPGGPGAPTLELLGAGRAEAAITAADDLLLKRHRGVTAVGVWPAFQNTPLGLMVHAAEGLTKFEQLAGPPGHRVAIEVGGPFQIFLWKRNGWGQEVQAVPYGGSVGPFLIDPTLVQQAYITSEPCAARAKGAEVGFLEARLAGWNPYGTVLAVADPVPEWAPAFVAATRASWEAYLAAPQRANARIAELNEQLTTELTDCIFAAQRPFVEGEDGLGAMTAARWEATAKTLVEIDLLPAGSTADGAWRAVSSAGVSSAKAGAK